MKNVFVPAWKNHDQQAYDEFHKFLFSGIIKRDRLSKHYTKVYEMAT